MNIFDVLSQGKARLHEPSISPMLGYLLDTGKDHGLGDSFLRAFLSQIQTNIDAPFLRRILDRPFIETTVSLEEPYSLDAIRKDIDIQVSINSRNREEDCKIIIENKIRSNAVRPNQLMEYYEAVMEDDNKINNLIAVFITPKSNSRAFYDEFSNLNVRNGHYKFWLYWNDGTNSVVNFVQSILRKDFSGEITPLNEYVRHTLKAFILHVRSFLDDGGENRKRFGENIGDVVDTRSVKLANGRIYTLVRRDSGQIQVFFEGEKVVAKNVLRELITERGLNIPLTGIDTRKMGAMVLDELSDTDE